MKDKILEIIKEESENANIRKYTCINGFGYSQFERNIADRVVKLFCQPVVIKSVCVCEGCKNQSTCGDYCWTHCKCGKK